MYAIRSYYEYLIGFCKLTEINPCCHCKSHCGFCCHVITSYSIHYTKLYELNNEGNTILDKDSDLIFMNPLEKGSQSLKKGVQEALKKDNGVIMYDLGGERTAYYKKLSHLDWRMFFATVGDEKIQTPPKLKLTLESFIPDLQNELNSIDTAVV